MIFIFYALIILSSTFTFNLTFGADNLPSSVDASRITPGQDQLEQARSFKKPEIKSNSPEISKKIPSEANRTILSRGFRT